MARDVDAGRMADIWRDGVSAHYMLAYDAGCRCYGYTDDVLRQASFN